MAITSNDSYKGISLQNAYIKALASVDVAIYKDQEQRKLGNVIGNKKIYLSNESMSKIYQIIKDEVYLTAVDILDDSWKSD